MKIALLILIALLSIAGYDHYNKNQTVKKQVGIAKMNEVQARYKKGAYIENESILSEHEFSKVIVYPSKLGEFFDNRCYVYTNSEIKSTSMTCDFNMNDIGNGYIEECHDKQGSYIC